MEIEIRMTANEEEIDVVRKVLRAIETSGEGEYSEEYTLSTAERTVLRAVQGPAEGGALRTVHRAAAKIDDSVEWTDSWGDERERVQSMLGTLRNNNLVRVEDRSYYLTEKGETILNS